MVGVMKRVDDNSYLEQRGRVWWYNRRVPSKFAHLDSRKRIKESLGTTSIDQARYKRDLLAEADDHAAAVHRVGLRRGGVHAGREMRASRAAFFFRGAFFGLQNSSIYSIGPNRKGRKT